jgi:CBS domain-containing protein
MTTHQEAATAAMLMNPQVKTVTGEMTLSEVVRFLVDHKLSIAPVVTEGPGKRNVVVGVITEKDCVDQLAEEMFYGGPRPIRTVETMMNRHPVCIAPETEMFSLCSLFATHGLRHAPVTEEDGHLVGIIGRRDILKYLDKYYGDAQRESDLKRFRPDPRLVSNLRFFSKS